MADLVSKLRKMEARQAALLAEMTSIDAQLGTLSPADPDRAGLKSRKAEVLARYQGMKATVKQLRRQINAGDWRPPKEEPAEVDEVVEDVDEDAMLERLYQALARVLDRRRMAPHGLITLLDSEVDVIEDFVNWMEHDT